MNLRRIKHRVVAKLCGTRVVTITLHGELAEKLLAMRPQQREQVIRLALETRVDQLDTERVLT